MKIGLVQHSAAISATAEFLFIFSLSVLPGWFFALAVKRRRRIIRQILC